MDNKYLIINYNKNSTRHFHITKIFDHLVEQPNSKYEFIEFDEIINNSTNSFNLKIFFETKYKCIPKYIIAFSGVSSFEYIIDVISSITQLVFIIDDIHHEGILKKHRIKVINKLEIIFCSYSYQFERWGLPKPKNLFFFPHSARWICDFNSNPINKILISGRISSIYPDREFAHNKALKYPSVFDVLKCNINYRINNDDPNNDDKKIYGEKFYQYLNNYLCCFVDTSRDYILGKTFEICASGSLLLCIDTNVKHIMNELGFEDELNYISCSRENFMDKAKWIINSKNKNKINIIRNNGYELIKKSHTWVKRMKYLSDILDNNNDNHIHYNQNVN